MAVYLYFCPKHNEFEIEHSMSETITECPKCKEEGLEPQQLKRLIAGGGTFILSGGGWAKDNYS